MTAPANPANLDGAEDGLVTPPALDRADEVALRFLLDRDSSWEGPRETADLGARVTWADLADLLREVACDCAMASELMRPELAEAHVPGAAGADVDERDEAHVGRMEALREAARRLGLEASAHEYEAEMRLRRRTGDAHGEGWYAGLAFAYREFLYEQRVA